MEAGGESRRPDNIPGTLHSFITSCLIRREGNTTIMVDPGILVKVKDMVDMVIPLKAGWNLVGNPSSYPFSSDSLTVTRGSITARAYHDGTDLQNGWYTSGAHIRTLLPRQGAIVKWSSIVASSWERPVPRG